MTVKKVGSVAPVGSLDFTLVPVFVLGLWLVPCSDRNDDCSLILGALKQEWKQLKREQVSYEQEARVLRIGLSMRTYRNGFRAVFSWDKNFSTTSSITMACVISTDCVIEICGSTKQSSQRTVVKRTSLSLKWFLDNAHGILLKLKAFCVSENAAAMEVAVSKKATHPRIKRRWSSIIGTFQTETLYMRNKVKIKAKLLEISS